MDFMILREQFHENHMILNPGKCHYIAVGDTGPSHRTTLNSNKIARSNEEKPSGNLSDSKLNFDSHITSLCKKM